MQNFSSKLVSQIIRASYRQLQYWDETGLVKPSINQPSGKGTVRIYSFTDLIQLKVLKELRGEGVSLQKIRRCLSYLRRNMPQIKRPLTELKFLTNGESIFVLTADKKAIIDTLKKGQLIFSFALGRMVEALKGEILRFKKPIKQKVKVRGKEYNIVLTPELEEGDYSIKCLGLPGCRSQGETVDDCLDMIKDAIELWLDTAKELKAKKKNKRAS